MNGRDVTRVRSGRVFFLTVTRLTDVRRVFLDLSRRNTRLRRFRRVFFTPVFCFEVRFLRIVQLNFLWVSVAFFMFDNARDFASRRVFTHISTE